MLHWSDKLSEKVLDFLIPFLIYRVEKEGHTEREYDGDSSKAASSQFSHGIEVHFAETLDSTVKSEGSRMALVELLI